MNALRLTLMVLSVTAIVVSGCSSDNLLTTPADNNNLEIENDLVNLSTPVEIGGNARVGSGSFEYEIDRIDFLAKVGKLDLEGGCWYLESTESVRYTPYFDTDAPRLREGLGLYVSGYVDKNLNSSCQVGPVFVVEKYKLVTKDDSRTDIEVKASDRPMNSTGTELLEDWKSVAAIPEDEYQDELVNLKGYLRVNEDGCLYLSSDDQIIAELDFGSQSTGQIPDGKLVAVKGSFSLLTISPCQLGPLFNVEKMQVIEGKDQPRNNEDSRL